MLKTNAFHCTVDTKPFLRELEWCKRFIETKATIPVLCNVLFERRDDLLYLSATDLEFGGKTSIPVSEGPDFEFTAPVELLIKYLKKVDDRTVTLLPELCWSPEYEGPHPDGCQDGCRCGLEPSIVSAALRLTHGEDGSMRVEGITASSYPCLPAQPLATLELYGLETAIPRALVSVSNEESRFTLNGALLTVEGKEARLISTDGHRLSAVDLKTHDAGKVRALIPAKALRELARLGDSAFFCADADHVFFSVGERLIITRKLTGNFPDFERVLPTDLRYAIDVDVAPLQKVLDRVSLFADERSHCIVLSVNGALNIKAQSSDRGGAVGKVPLDCVRRLDGDNGFDVLPNGLAYPYGSGFNALYIAQFLKAAGVSDVRFLFNCCKNAAEWAAPGWRYVLMPMRDDGAMSDPCAVGDYELLQWAKDEACTPAPAPAPEIAIPDVPATPVASPDVDTSNDVIDAVAAAALLGMHQATVYVRVKQGRLPAPHKRGRSMVWHRSELTSYAAIRP